MAREPEAHKNLLQQLTEHEDEPLGTDPGEGDDDFDGSNDDKGDIGEDDDDTGDDTDDNDAGDDDTGDDGVDDENDDITADDKRKPTTDPVVDDDDPDKNFQYQQNRAGDIVDVDGKVLFARGRPRNAWSKLKKAWKEQQDISKGLVQHAQTLASAGRQLLAQYNELKDTANFGASKGLTAQEAKEAVELMAHAKIDPKAAIRSILTKLHLAGTDLSDLGVTAPVDAREVAKYVVEQQETARLKREGEVTTARRNAAKEEAQAFLLANPGAVRYQGLIAKAKTDWPHMSLQQIWIELQKGARKALEKNNKQRRGNDDQRRGGERQLREPPARNGSRDRPNGSKLSLKAVDPSRSFKQIGAELLRDLQQLDKR